MPISDYTPEGLSLYSAVTGGHTYRIGEQTVIVCPARVGDIPEHEDGYCHQDWYLSAATCTDGSGSTFEQLAPRRFNPWNVAQHIASLARGM